MPFTMLFDAISDIVPPTYMEKINTHYESFRVCIVTLLFCFPRGLGLGLALHPSQSSVLLNYLLLFVRNYFFEYLSGKENRSWWIYQKFEIDSWRSFVAGYNHESSMQGMSRVSAIQLVWNILYVLLGYAVITYCKLYFHYGYSKFELLWGGQWKFYL